MATSKCTCGKRTKILRRPSLSKRSKLDASMDKQAPCVCHPLSQSAGSQTQSDLLSKCEPTACSGLRLDMEFTISAASTLRLRDSMTSCVVYAHLPDSTK